MSDAFDSFFGDTWPFQGTVEPSPPPPAGNGRQVQVQPDNLTLFGPAWPLPEGVGIAEAGDAALQAMMTQPSITTPAPAALDSFFGRTWEEE